MLIYYGVQVELVFELTFFALGIALATFISEIQAPGYGTAMEPVFPSWYGSAALAFLSISLAVNTLVTGLIAYKIHTLYRDIQSKPHDIYTHHRDPRDLYYPTISIVVESGFLTFVAQLVQILVYKLDIIAFPIVAPVIMMLYVRGIMSIINLVFHLFFIP